MAASFLVASAMKALVTQAMNVMCSRGSSVLGRSFLDHDVRTRDRLVGPVRLSRDTRLTAIDNSLI